MRKPGRLLIGASIALLTVIWGTTWAGIRISLQGIPPLSGVSLRFALASLLLFAFARALGVPLRAAHRRERWLRLIHAVLSFTISYGVVFWCEQWVPSGVAAVLFATFTLMVAVMAHFLLPGERMTALGFVGVAVGLAGVAIIYAEDFDLLGGDRVAVASVVMLAAPLASAAANVAVKRWGADLHPVSLNAAAMGMGCGLIGAVALVAERQRPLQLDPAPVAALVYLAVAGSAVTFSLYYWLMRHMQVSRLALIGYGTPVVALFVGAMWLDEPLPPRALLGSLLVVIGVACAARRPRGKHADEAPASLDAGPGEL